MDASDDGRRSSFASCDVASGDAASINMIAPQTARHARRSQTNGLTWTESPEINAFINADSANETASSVTGESFVADSLSIAMHRQDIAANELAQIAKMNVTPNVADEGKACCASTQDRTSAGSTRAIMRGFRTSLLCEIKRTVALTASAMILRSRAIRRYERAIGGAPSPRATHVVWFSRAGAATMGSSYRSLRCPTPHAREGVPQCRMLHQ